MRRYLLTASIVAVMVLMVSCSKNNPTQNTTTGTLTGKVTNEFDGSVVAGVRIQIQETGDTAVSDAQGSYTISNVKPGSYNVNASKTGFETTFTSAVLTAGTTTTLNILLSPPLPAGKGRITGRVVDADGAPMAGVTVRTDPPTMTATSDANGYYRLVPIDMNFYQVIATKPTFIPDTATGDIRFTTTADSVNFTLRDSVPKKGLIAYYQFNGDANDASGRNNNGTNSGAAGTTDRFGVTGGAMAFNGSSSFISVPSSNDVNLGGATSDFTISFWAKFTGSTDNAGVMSKATDDPTYLIAQGYEFYVYKGSSGGYSLGSVFVGQNKVQLTFDGESNFWTDGQWHHIAMTFSRMQNSARRYSNGFQWSGLSLDSNDIKQDFSNALPLIFGKDASGNNFFNGAIDDVRIYNRALSEEEVSMLFHERGWQ